MSRPGLRRRGLPLARPPGTTASEDCFAPDFSTFVNSRSRACENCNAQREAGLTVEGYVDIGMDYV